LLSEGAAAPRKPGVAIALRTKHWARLLRNYAKLPAAQRNAVAQVMAVLAGELEVEECCLDLRA